MRERIENKQIERNRPRSDVRACEAKASVAVTRESVSVDTTNTAGSEPSSYVWVPLSRIETRLLDDSLANIEENRNSLA